MGVAVYRAACHVPYQAREMSNGAWADLMLVPPQNVLITVL